MRNTVRIVNDKKIKTKYRQRDKFANNIYGDGMGNKQVPLHSAYDTLEISKSNTNNYFSVNKR